jgi:hypothetical protein
VQWFVDEGKYFFSIYVILPAALGPGFTQHPTEMITRSRKENISGE